MSVVTNMEGRLGLRTIARDHVATWSTRTGVEGRTDRRQAAAWYFGVPTLLALPFLYWHYNLNGLAQLLSGVAVFTGLLFGLLILMFNTGITLRKDGKVISNAHGLRELVGDIRANTTWAITVGLLLAGTLIIASATSDPNQPTPWGFTPVVTWLFVHLGLTVFTILRRFRTAFNYITR